MTEISVVYQDDQFRFVVAEMTEDVLRGHFPWTDEEKARLLALFEQEDEEGVQPWYLDDNGDRLSDDRLFGVSPWSIVVGETCRKAIQRTMDYETGAASFCFTPWFRIGDEFSHRPSESRAIE